MKSLLAKRILIIALSVVATVGAGFGVAALAGAFENEENSSSIQSSTSSNSSNEEIENRIEVVQRNNASEVISENIKMVTLKDAYLVLEGDMGIFYSVTDGVLVGDLIKLVAEQVLSFEYCSDGNWYVVEENDELTQFKKVPNVIFNYELGSNQALDLSELELEMYGSWKVMETILGQFGIGSLDSVLTGILPANISEMMKALTEMTVLDLYNITAGDYTYVKTFLEKTDIDYLTGSVFDILSFTNPGEYHSLGVLLKDLLNGTISNPEINQSIRVNVIVETLFDYIPESDLTVEVEWQITSLYRNVILADLYTATLELEIEDIIDAVVEILIVQASTPEEEAEIEKWQDLITNIVSGTVGEPIFNENGDYTALITEILLLAEVENATETAQKILSIMGVINDLVNKGEENAKTDKEIAYETIVKIFDCNAEDENVKEFATDLSSAIVEFCNGSVAEFTAFEQKYSTLTLQTADTYLGEKVSSLATSLGYDISEFLASNTVADLSKIINTVLTNANVSLDEFALKISEYIKAESVQTQEIMQQIFNEVSKILEDNRRLTIGEIVGDSSSISEDLASLTIGDIMDLITELKESFSPQNVTLGDIDRLLLDNVIEDFIKNYNVNGILDLTLEDCMSILSLNATNSALEVLDSVLLLDFVDLISKLANEQIPPQV